MEMMDANEIISFISNSKKSTPVKVYIKGENLKTIDFGEDVKDFVHNESGVLFGLGGRATVGKNCHIGAGTVLAGVIEPPSAKPVVVEDEVVIGANVVVLEGVTVGKGSVVAAGAVVTQDVPPNSVVAGTPAKVIKEIDEQTRGKTEIKQELRKLDQ